MTADRERGSSTLELALISTTLFGFLFGILTFAMVEASDLSGANAAREGARQGVLNYACADLHSGCSNPNPALTAVTNAVKARLGGLAVGGPTVTVTCFDGSTTPLVTKSCDSAVIVSDLDLLQVKVSWTRLATTAFGTSTTHTDQATMVIQGSGQGTNDTTACIVTSATVNPTQASIASGQTSGPLWPSTTQVTVTANTNGLCEAVYLSFSTGSSPDQANPTSMLATGSTFTYTIASSQYNWAAGTYNMTFSDGAGHPYSTSPTPVLTVSTAVCSIISASVSPTAALLSGPSPSPLTAGATVSVQTSAGCVSLSTTFTPNGTPLVVGLVGSTPNFSLTIASGDYSWTPGAKQFTFTDSVANLPLQTPQSVILQVATRCAVTVALNPSTMKHNKITAVAVSATPIQGSDCTGLSMTYTYASNSSATASMVLQGSGVYTYSIPSSTAWTAGTWTFTFSSPNSPAVTTNPSPIYEVIT